MILVLCNVFRFDFETNMKACAQKSWGRIKQSRAFQILLSLLAILPLVDIGTDYAFVIVSFEYANEESEYYKLQQSVKSKFNSVL